MHLSTYSSQPFAGRSAICTGATATNFARYLPKACRDQIVKMSGMDNQHDDGEHLSPEMLSVLAEKLKQNLCHPGDVARAVLYAVTQPIEVNIADIVVRPPKAMKGPH